MPERPHPRLGRLRQRQARQRAAAGGGDIGRSLPEGSEQEPADESVTAFPPAPVPEVRAARGRLWGALLHPGRGQVVIAALLFLLGMAGVLQIRSNAADDTYRTARREDLVQLLDGLGEESRRLEAEIAALERTRAELQSGVDTDQVAREQAQRRLDELSILAGTAPAQGPGIRLRIADPRNLVEAPVLVDAVQELRDAGAEVIEINDEVRLVAGSWFGQDGNGLVVDGRPVSRPLVIEAIGDPHSLEEGARFRGGIVSEITGPRIGGQVQIERLDLVVVASLRTLTANRHATPASSAGQR